jgi:5-methylcytosine-specific restriction enzyme subunit McrC
LNLSVKDCSPFDPKPSATDAAWLGRLAAASMHGDLVIRLEEGREDEPVVWCERDGSWWAGRYIGSLTFEGRRLDIRPRFGENTLRAWFAGAFNLALAETRGQLIEDNWFVPWLLASVWSRSFVLAARHGLPALRTDICESGLSIKGRLEVPGTVRLRATGNRGARSLRREKTLVNPITAAVVAAHAELSRWLGSRRDCEWMPERVKDLMPHLIAAVGSRPRLPTRAELDRVRLTPITAGFRPLAELSVLIAGRRGLQGNAADQGECKGMLLDVAELWELYVLAVLRRTWPAMDVAHGTRGPAAQALLRNDRGEPLGLLKPDAVIGRGGRIAAVADAKYKRLWSSRWSLAPQREDLYQLAAYLGRYGDAGNRIPGALLYPSDPANPTAPPAEAGNPWYLDAGNEVRFITLPHDIDEAVRKMTDSMPFVSGLASIAASRTKKGPLAAT